MSAALGGLRGPFREQRNFPFFIAVKVLCELCQVLAKRVVRSHGWRAPDKET
jgi:hypothetical protein